MSNTVDIHELEVQEKVKILERLYPDADESKFKDWAEQIVNHNADFKLPLTENQTKYKWADVDEKDAKAKKEKLRKEVIQDFKDLDHPIEGITHRQEQRLAWKQQELVNWVLATKPALIAELLVPTIDIKKLEEAVAEQKISAPPDTCYTVSNIDVVTVIHKKDK